MFVSIICNIYPPFKFNLDINCKNGTYYKLANRLEKDKLLPNIKSDKNKLRCIL